jgi:hypothetical protein
MFAQKLKVNFSSSFLFKNNFIYLTADRTPQWALSPLFDDENTSLFLTTSNNSDKVSLFLSCSRRIWNLREQMTELKLRYTPTLRSLQNALRYN